MIYTFDEAVQNSALAPYNLIAGDALRAAVYANGKNLPVGAASFKIKVKYADSAAGANGDGKDKIKLDLSLTAPGVYELFEQSQVFAAVPSDIKAQIQFKAASGKLYIDDLSISVPSGGVYFPCHPPCPCNPFHIWKLGAVDAAPRPIDHRPIP